MPGLTRKTALFVTYGGGHGAMVAAVVKSLLARDLEVRVLALTTARATFEREGIPFLGFKDFLEDSDQPALRLGQGLAATMHSAHTGIPAEESIAYLGLSYADLITRLGEAPAAELLEKEGRKAFLPLGVMKRVFDRLRPDVLVTTNSPRAEQAARLVAAERGIPIVGLTDLLGTHIHPMVVDHLCLACEHALKRYRESPLVRAGEYHVVGNPAMDAALAHRGPPDPEWRRRHFPTSVRNPFYILTAEQIGYQRKSDQVLVPWTPGEIRENLDRLYEASRDLNGVLLVRPHPSLPPGPYATWAAGKPEGSVHLAATQALYPLLRSTDLVISNLSTLMLDSLYMNRPVLLVRYPDSTTLLPFDEMGFAFTAPMENPAGLRQGMSDGLKNLDLVRSKSEAFREEFPDLPCAPRVAKIIEGCL